MTSRGCFFSKEAANRSLLPTVCFDFRLDKSCFQYCKFEYQHKVSLKIRIKSLMKRVVIGLFCLTSFTIPIMAGILGSAHDFSGAGWNRSGEICIVCHTPNSGESSVTAGPLWNHDITSASFTLYTSDTLDATLEQPDGLSKLCLSCHDGTVALDSFGGTAGSFTLAGSALMGTDLSGNHPIGFTFDAALAAKDGELFDPSSKASGLGSTIAADMLYDGKLRCPSCHDVHNTAGNSKLLIKSNAGSALCLTCHNK